MRTLFVFFMLAAIGFDSFCLESGNSGKMVGIVTDRSTHQPLPGATVKIKGTTFGAVSDNDGKYEIAKLPPAVYAAEVSLIGYASVIVTDIEIAANRAASCSFELQQITIEISKSTQITSGYFEKDPSKSVSLKRLTPQEIKAAPGSSEDVFRVIHSLPGVTTGSMANSNLIVRGGAPDENLTLLDNIEINSPLHFGKLDASMGTISIINPNLLESVEFSSGGFPAEFGGKLSSLFELRMKDGNNNRLNSDFNVNMAGFGYSADGPLTNNTTLVFSARRGYFDILTRMMGKKMMPRFWDAAGKISHDIGRNDKLSFVGFYYNDGMEKNEYEPDSHNAESRKYDYLKNDVFGSAFGLNWRHLLGNTGYMLTTASVTTNGWTTKGGNADGYIRKYDDVTEREYTVKNETVLRLSDFSDIKVGGYFKAIDSDYLKWKKDETLTNGFVLKGDTAEYNPGNANKAGAFIQSTFKPHMGLSLTVGLRDDYFSLTKENTLNPRVSLSYKLSSTILLNAAFAKLNQDPAAYQICIAAENKNLKSSKADQYIAGIDWLIRDDINFTVEAYYKKLTNTFTGTDTSAIISNSGSGTVKGIEFLLQKKMSDDLVGSLSYTYSVSKRKELPGGREYDFDYDRTHNLNISGSYRINENWQAGVKFSYSTGTPYTPVTGFTSVNGVHAAVMGEKNSARLPEYQELDIRVDRKFYFDNWTLNVYIDIWNILNRKNIIDYNQRVVSPGNIIKIAVPDFGLLPILGVSAQF